MIIIKGIAYIQKEDDWYSLKINERARFDGRNEEILRVPGGWIHMHYKETGTGTVYSSECFIPSVLKYTEED